MNSIFAPMKTPNCREFLPRSQDERKHLAIVLEESVDGKDMSDGHIESERKRKESVSHVRLWR